MVNTAPEGRVRSAVSGRGGAGLRPAGAVAGQGREVNVLFVCVQNAGRSQIAEALYTRAGGNARSAGTAPAERVHPEVVEVMREIGLELGGRTPHRLDDSDVEWADVVVTMGCGDACPVLPGKRYLDWELVDPAGKPLEQVRAIRDEIARLVKELASAGEKVVTGSPEPRG